MISQCVFEGFCRSGPLTFVSSEVPSVVGKPLEVPAVL